MRMDDHEKAREGIDALLVSGLTPEEERTLRVHLDACAPCSEYLEQSHRAIAGLSEFSFEVDPRLQQNVRTAITWHAAQLESAEPGRLRGVASFLLALMLTGAGWLAVSRLGSPVAAALHVQFEQVQFGLIAFWVVPSLGFTLLLPFLPSLSARWMDKKGRV